MSYPKIKRWFDVLFAGVGLVLLSPLGVLIALSIKLSDGGPIFYGQVRLGQFGWPFRMWKFRSMVINADRIGAPLTRADDPRITRLGRVLRQTKLDELPQLWNVLVGDMSLVGPRPEVSRYVAGYSPEQLEILARKPGITDLASVLFRNEEALLGGRGDVEQFYARYCLPRKIELNRQYAERANLLKDLWIIFQTLCPSWLAVLILYGIWLSASLWLAYQLHFDFHTTTWESDEFIRVWPWVVVPQSLLLLCRRQCRALMSCFGFQDLRQIGAALGIALITEIGFGVFSQGRFTPGLGILAVDFMLAFATLCAVRLFLRSFCWHRSTSKRKSPRQISRVAIIGADEPAARLAVDLGAQPHCRTVVAIFDDNPRRWHKRLHDIPIVGMPECLLSVDWLAKVDEVFIALPEQDSNRVKQIAELLRPLPLRVTVASAWQALTLVEFHPATTSHPPVPALLGSHYPTPCRSAFP